MYTFEDLEHIIEELRSDHGCPWDKEQTHESLKKCLVEESQEVLDAIDNHDKENLCEELGDVLLQVMMHSQIAMENGDFTVDDVVNGICEKMIRRHPHVFGDKKASSPEESLALWNEIKKQEKAKKP
ncbi:nucleotide pyrophosphohydrolase [Clostridium sp. chh4-2]|uniref:MazG family protein n=1 Tax=Clostridium sp. chh4-2 TaxID=2067550 RepID=UPI000CCDFB0F|nr:MazG family protein [Clostridium sp. chh4-2]PNV62429.1 nucleotide pyrophosphohydrolase [Clostridium sp. chh4-2]